MAASAPKAVEEGKQRGEGRPEVIVGGGERKPAQPVEGRTCPQTQKAEGEGEGEKQLFQKPLQARETFAGGQEKWEARDHITRAGESHQRAAQ